MSRILMVSSEAAPFAKTGGLADVLGALPKALVAQGEEVGVVLPLYESGNYPSNLSTAYHDMYVWLGSNSRIVHIRGHQQNGVQYFFVDEPALFGRESLYGVGGADYPDNHIRFATLCHAALGVIRHLFRPDIVHCHDWQTGLLPPLLRWQYRRDPTFFNARLLFTIHNMGYQGLFPSAALADIGIDPALFRPDGLEFWGKVNFLKAGLQFSDAINTVSPTYAKEIQRPEFGFGLDGLLRARRADLSGILNGVDYDEWSPEVDPAIAANYSAQDLAGKPICKAELLRRFGLPSDDLTIPLIGVVSRLAHQKGFDLVTAIGDKLAQENLMIVILGSGQPEFEQALLDLAARYPDRIAIRIGYDNELSHQVEAGADLFLMPSQYEPCGLNQIYSLRYGTLPIVRATGGLDDTIDAETGFKFADYTPAALLGCVREALAAYQNKPRWLKMIRTAMERDYSWNASAREYRALYRRLQSRTAAGAA